MKIEIQSLFLKKLNRQVAYIASDKPQAARRFKQKLLNQIRTLESHPLKHRKSIYFEDDTIRGMIFMGYVIVYKIELDKIIVFGLMKYEQGFK
ncbi:type II toxin-antitoxin system RelE/ParE family toxin [Algoriphagus sp. AGSA1]|uniref:type II toxin-antitoxin system RelE/ParE family toxin n=1 Tax=Algoriphagus sp. AGSA1 TaxID=2907213 RepID=UPI001F370228|nr:type II toxin-antitoxin system RelE/ParE family toxin [Algoriphagus sp. AGSA1]MCE7055543.1 type II toxin-antitoxin system RelE/ParE family toxin [Algoriphagus sp. AGSA1]